jgi:predicted amidohydrolase YtcJ
MWAATTRQTLEGKPEGGWFPEERVSLSTALHAYTTVNAWAEGMENEKGTIMPGQLADLAVWDRNPLGAPIGTLKDRKIMLTIMDGRVVFERP